MIPQWIRWLHFVGLILYAGGFLALTRLVGHAVRFESVTARADAYRVLKRMHRFVDWPGLGILLATGLTMLFRDYAGKHYMKQGYFHQKLTLVLVLLVADYTFSAKLFRLQAEGVQPSATFFRVLHGIAALAVVGALAAVTMVKG